MRSLVFLLSAVCLTGLTQAQQDAAHYGRGDFISPAAFVETREGSQVSLSFRVDQPLASANVTEKAKGKQAGSLQGVHR